MEAKQSKQDAVQSAAQQAGEVFSRKASGLDPRCKPMDRTGIFLRSAKHYASQFLPALGRHLVRRRPNANLHPVHVDADPIRCHLHLLLISHATLRR